MQVLSKDQKTYFEDHADDFLKERGTVIDQIAAVMIPGNHENINILFFECRKEFIQNIHRVGFWYRRIINIAGKNDSVHFFLYCFFHDLPEDHPLVFHHRIAVHFLSKMQVT